ncbi:hypothetical protein VKT23_020242 [Stygiomarasmius scandens]|uniref:CxC2-like cysteine cluster KDZ transposase-associated domain-containing protein n=1 Tax=Marasmiellus scandens TaxID=2682957 RepID=A0ABR1IJI2_9AGAR
MSKKRKLDNAFGWYQEEVSTATTFFVSDDQRRLNSRLEIDDEDPAHASSEYGSVINEDKREHSFEVEDDFNPQDFDFDATDNPFSYSWGEESIYRSDVRLQHLVSTQQDDSAHVFISRRSNLHSDNPSRAWLAFRQEYLDELLWVEGRRGLGGECSRCKVSDPKYRCADEECVLAGMMCKECMVSAHQMHPLHWIEYWNGIWFEPETLKNLGLVVQLGHKPGDFCVFYTSAHSDFTVIHTNSIHEVSVRFCGCDGFTEHRKQLLQTLWYPATPVNPQTATTFSCLRQFQHLNCHGKLPAYDYYHCLEIMTQSRQRRRPNDRYYAFLQSIFQWRHLKMCKRAGRGHSLSGLEGTAQGELALDCPACPNPGKNIPDDWRNVPPELAYVIVFILMDNV